MTTASDDACAAVLHALRVKGAATATDVAVIAGIADAGPALAMLAGDGLVQCQAAGGREYFRLTAAGSERDAQAMRALIESDTDGALAREYDRRFLPLNVRFKALCAKWQEQGESIELIEQSAEIHDEIDVLLTTASGYAPHLARYRERLGSSMDKFLDGDATALTAPVGVSYHNTWFELHEDLLATLGRSREQEGE